MSASFTPDLDQAGPSKVSIALAIGILSVAFGYFLGSASSIGLIGGRKAKRAQSKGSQPRKSWPNSYDVTIHPDSSDEELMKSLGRGAKDQHSDSASDEDDDDDGDKDDEVTGLSQFSESEEEFKMVLVVRTDLGMGKGKIAAQASHATLACYTTLSAKDAAHPVLRRWKSMGQAKIALQAQSEYELQLLQAQAISLGLCAKIIHDAGRTQIASGTATVLGIGPGPKSVIDQVTGSLKLL